MKIYHYDHDGVFLNSDTADEDPLIPGNYLIPAQSTEIEPPFNKEGYVPVFDGSKWEMVVDKRGLSYWTVEGTEIKIEEVGKDIPEDAFASKDLVPKTKEELDLEKIVERRERMLSGSDYNGVMVSLTSDDGGALIQVKNAFELGVKQTVIRFENGSRISMTAEEFPYFAKWFVTERNKFFEE